MWSQIVVLFVTNYAFFTGTNEILTIFYIFCSTWMKVLTEALQVMLLSSFEFRENYHNASHPLLKGVNKFRIKTPQSEVQYNK
jgi:hypothetical protein